MQNLRLEKEDWNKKFRNWDIVSEHVFEDTTDMINYLKNAQVNTRIFGSHCISQSVGKDDDFHDFETYEEALNGLEFGTDLYYKEFKNNVKRVKDFLASQEIKKVSGYKNDFIGFIPIVPNAIIGNPINMINSNMKPKPIPTARIVIEKANNAGVSSKDMVSFYAIITALIEILEQKGIRCEVWTSAVFEYSSSEVYEYKLKLKNYNQPMNMYKIQFPIIASDMFRRVGFRLLETNFDIQDTDWECGYGHTLICKSSEFSIQDNGRIKEGLKNLLQLDEKDIFIPNCNYFNHRKNDDIKETIEKIIRQTNFNKYIKLGE